ncbi:hypothetical protein A3765_08515 [Oleiphilus sp. HI0130]|uniref:substrate-binding periplasmic protein n=4 Tax=unclassified Oleiphilus TaxID=2631174 RepID=UPI0007C2D57D|nr:transporter substrate-binding domain-containing protein [Oleiphilus sp. HI0079]KZY64700.1 hypothetical protein A3737_13945 [Oleiphilus sp. HI0065]KZZ43730.1 hypothetical protein A3758_03820 [Oleiphilus sp. HI0118]KZZ78015.1 hypothetical protein A3765_08515 [Oleiphilus sp. HI0130]KZZ80955.1 hypothetical protein A3767_09560 [Oleiphilus sp. HI0133]KZY72237.1 hypothetical protein A3737_16575 [Oleiphilus sp. HI0065]
MHVFWWKTLSVCFWLSLCLPAFAQGNDSNEKTLTFVKQNSKPKYFEANAEGLCGEIYTLLASGLAEKGVEVEVLPMVYPIKRILTMLEDGRANVFCGAGRNAERELRYIYSSRPVYSVSNVVSARDNSKYTIDSIADISNKKLIVAALFGSSSGRWLRSHDGLRISDKYHSPDEALLALNNNEKIDLFFYHDLGLNYLTKTTYTSLRVLPVKFRTVSQWLIYSKHTTAQSVRLLEAQVSSITKSGELKRIQEKYL